MGKRRLIKSPSAKEKRRAKGQWTTWVLIGGAVAILGVIAALVLTQSGPNPTSGKAHVGDPAPDFTLRLLNGENVALASLKGKPVLLNFWAST
jgi:cytochrome c biogenesis protein CcmG/thiol:disulfide interchange protein DsbE